VRFTAPVRLAGDGVVLRPLRSYDAREFARAFADDPQLGPWVGFEEDPDEDWFRDSLDEDQGPGFQLAVTDDGSDTFLGIAHVNCLLCHNGRGHLDSLSLWGYYTTRQQAWGMASFMSRTATTQTGQGVQPWSLANTRVVDYQLNTTTGNRPARCTVDTNGRCNVGLRVGQRMNAKKMRISELQRQDV